MAKINDEDIDNLRESADIAEIVSGYTQLKRSGGHTFKGLCPFHSEKTPSFSVDTAKNLWHCFAADTGVITWNGTFPIGKLAGETHRLLTLGGLWVDAQIRSFGQQQLWEVELSRNRRRKTIYTTDGHRWFVRSGAGARSIKEVLTRDLKPGNRLPHVFPRTGNLLATGPSPFGVAHGFAFGDGTRDARYGSSAQFCRDKDAELLKYFPEAKVWTKGRTRIGRLPLFFKDRPPLDEAPGYVYGWLAGYFAADGCVSTDGQVVMSSASRDNLEFVRTIANRLGIGTYGIKSQARMGYGSTLTNLYHLTFINSTVPPEFFVLSRHRRRFEETAARQERERKGWVVRSVRCTDQEAEVFCAVVPGTHAFALEDNILTGNCFGCSKGGNVYTFVQEIENLPFPEAVEWLARKTGFPLRYEESRPGEAQRSGLKARLVEANKLATAFFHDALMTSSDAKAARDYLGGRGFGKEVAERWQLGYGPGRDSLTRHLLGKGFTQDELLQANLSLRSERDGNLFDAFRQRIIFPTWNLQGDVVAFGARALGDQQPKYLNSAETPVFSKSRIMYGLNRAKSAIARGAALVVEGYTDVIALHEAGIQEAVATNGVALGETHFELLKKFSSRAVLMFDSDAAGAGATERGFGIHHRIGLEVLVAPLPPGRDPADVVTQDGSDGIKKVIESAQPLLEFKLEQTIGKLPLDTPEARSRAVGEAVKVLGLNPDQIARHQYAFMVARRIGVDPETVQRALQEDRTNGSTVAGGASDSQRDRRLPGHVKVEREALQLLLTRTREMGAWFGDIAESDFTSPPRRELFKRANEAHDAGRAYVGADVVDEMSPEARSLFTELTVSGDAFVAVDAASVREVFVRIKVFKLEKEIKTKRNTLQDVNPLVDPQKHDDLFTQLVGLEAERRDLLRQLQGVA
ncbi:MAG TPA: DNA primase [Actinomycetota bacterium]|jgi:DNA primase